ncbi:G-patch domain-containing protein [Drechmeria coniospora]|uniref:G-patch domain-containing protein n=1 Tax=Drechmeria coniospora TaxID=98403 RepID=A0A151GB42_DRECN|nr:G-patch domain-containing protein [Drechmeria coniospora]KYK54265.1 G-patch domain-containing protein [Drechmeria coniospora]
MENATNLSFDPSRLTKAAAEDYSSSASEDEDEYVVPGFHAEDDDFGDFNPRKRRRVGRDNKEQAALGIFGSDSDDGGPGRRWKRKNLRSKGMNFVSTNVEPKEANGSEQADSDDSDDERPVLGQAVQDDSAGEDEEEDGGVSLGFRVASRGTGLTAASQATDAGTETKKQRRPVLKTKFDGSNVLGRGFVPSSAWEPVLNEPESRGTPPAQNKPQPSAFGAKGKINANSFGARMMAKMGYVEGTGLGKEGQGRNIIIEANLRPQGVGLGAVREKSERERLEEKRQARLRGEDVVDSDEDKKKRTRARRKVLGTAGNSAASTPRRQKTKYLTAEELKASAPGLNIPEAFTPILDMTGPEGKMLTSTSGVMTPTSAAPESAAAVEARKLVKRAQADLQAFSEEWQSLEERRAWLELELKEKERELEEAEADRRRLESFSSLVSDRLTPDSDWTQVVDCLAKAADLGPTSAEVADVAVAAVSPFMRDSDWDPLQNPARFATDLKQLSGLLANFGLNNDGRSLGKWDSGAAQVEGVYRRHHKATTPYESMMYKNWLPHVLAGIREWDPLMPAPMLAVVENWKDLLPPFIRAQVMDNIARKLEAAVSDWNPRKKRQAHHLPHSWLFPWLQYLPPYHLEAKGTGLVADVKRKFRQLADCWEFDRGPVPGMQQWEDVLGSEWRPLIMSHVLPAMGKYLRRNFRVDPADQEPSLPILTGVMKWQPILGRNVMAEVIVQDVFPMWHGKLREWLALDEADLAEVAEWYSWWRGSLLEDLAKTKSIGGELDKGMQLMNLV